jgi:cytochrome oxidase Cu insertion factor (SCO1/SenC/PrrC family)
MNHSLHSADRATHRKIVAVALIAGVLVAGVGFFARSGSDYAQTARVMKAGKPVTLTDSDQMAVR